MRLTRCDGEVAERDRHGQVLDTRGQSSTMGVCVCVCVCVCERERERDECLLTGQNYLQETTYYMCLLFEN